MQERATVEDADEALLCVKKTREEVNVFAGAKNCVKSCAKQVQEECLPVDSPRYEEQSNSRALTAAGSLRLRQLSGEGLNAFIGFFLFN